ncbi:hypothetical protein SY1_05190 [Fretibacterium fastidiosum]|uniref:Uncharacterized protein n=1 Tax=Fretibacterium fastidiosum TaxID=651822 RepID=A0AB94IW17_9BACT|nr:hypothetical protein SY1_05190 [Fretibacterium fastidiosum]
MAFTAVAQTVAGAHHLLAV